MEPGRSRRIRVAKIWALVTCDFRRWLQLKLHACLDKEQRRHSGASRLSRDRRSRIVVVISVLIGAERRRVAEKKRKTQTMVDLRGTREEEKEKRWSTEAEQRRTKARLRQRWRRGVSRADIGVEERRRKDGAEENGGDMSGELNRNPSRSDDGAGDETKKTSPGCCSGNHPEGRRMDEKSQSGDYLGKSSRSDEQEVQRYMIRFVTCNDHISFILYSNPDIQSST